jgi:succinate dehydrogenase/fumarate reductase flavoprotein subunit
VLKSPRSFWFVLRRLSKHFRDLALHGRSMELVSGMSLVAALAEAAFEEGVELRTSAAVESIVMDGTRVTGVRVRVGGREQIVRTRGGVILACGGFPHDVERQRKVFPHVAHGGEHKSPAPRTNTGDGIRMAERLGAYTPELSDAGAWAPCSQITWSDGQTEVFPHLIDRQKPGFIAVTRAGKRFTNESHSYHEYGRGLIAACAGQSETVSFLIGDHRTVRRYGVGVVRPWPVPLGPYLRAGYLLRGQTLAELAAVAGIDAANLQTTVQQYNQQARLGRDPEFHRGESPYNRFNGDPLQQPNPNVGPIERGPFYAVKVYVGELGTFGGLAIDERARTLRRDGTAIPGLYAAGNDISSPMAGNYAGGGTTLGPGLTFAFIAAQDIAQQLRRERDATSERTDEIVRSDRCEMAGSRE